MVEPRLLQLLQVLQTIAQAASLRGVQVLPAKGTVLAAQVVRDRRVQRTVCVCLSA